MADEDKKAKGNGDKPPGAQMMSQPHIPEAKPPQEPEQPSAQDSPASAAQMAQQFLSSFVYQVLLCTVRGMIVSLAQFHSQAVVITAARMMAHIIGESFSGPLADVLNARRLAREAFLDELTKSPIPAPPEQPPAPGMRPSPFN